MERTRVYGEGLYRIGTFLELSADMYTLLFITCLKLSELNRYLDLSNQYFKEREKKKVKSNENKLLLKAEKTVKKRFEEAE